MIKNEAWVTKEFKKYIANLVGNETHLLMKLSDRFNSGYPDFLLLHGATARFYELKAWNKELSKIQLYVCKKIVASGIPCFRFAARTDADNKVEYSIASIGA